MKIHWTKLALLITGTNIITWLFIELWIHRYAGGVAEVGAGWIAALQFLGYYICTIASQFKKIDTGVCEHIWSYEDTDIYKCIKCDLQKKSE